MKNSNEKKKILFIFVPILIVFLALGVGIKLIRDKRGTISVQNPIEEMNDYTYAKVYLLDNDNTLVPLTIKLDVSEDQGFMYHQLFNSLKDNAKYSSFKGYIPSSCKVNSLTIEDKTLSLDVSKEFNDYNEKHELKLLEGITWTLTQFEDVDNLSLSIDGTKIKNMNKKNTPVANLLNKDSIGINNFLLTSCMFSKGERVLSYYEKKIDNNYYYVPVTQYVTNKSNLSIYDLTVSTLFKAPEARSNLEVARCINETQIVNKGVVTDNVLYVSLTEDILFDELTVSKDVYELLKLTCELINDVNDVSFLFELEEYEVNGIKKDEEVKVSSIIFNKYYI